MLATTSAKQAAWKRLLVGELSWMRIARSALLIYVCLLVYAFVWSDRMIFRPQPPTYRVLPNLTAVPAHDGHAIPVLDVRVPESTYTVFFCHGNAEDLGEIRELLLAYGRRGLSAVSFDYRGYGVAAGRPTTRNACRDAETVFRHLTTQRGIPPGRIIMHGRSVGGGPALYVARKYPVAGVIAQSAFVSAFRVMTRVPLAPFDRFRNISRIAHIECPVLIMHGNDDAVIPVWHGKALYERARDPKMARWFEDVGHNDLPWAAEDEYWATIEDFVGSLTPEA